MLIFIIFSLIKIFSNHNIGVMMDDYYLLNMAYNIAHKGIPQICEPIFIFSECLASSYHLGWAALMSLNIITFGANLQTAFIFSSIFNSLSILFIFIVSFILFKNYKISFISALLFGFERISFNNSLSTNVSSPAITILLFNIIVFYLYLKKENISLGIVFFTSFLILIATKFEMILLAVPYLIVYFLKKKTINRVSFVLTNLSIPIIILIETINSLIVRDFDGKIGLSFQNFFYNSLEAFKIILNYKLIIVIFILILIPIFLDFKKNKINFIFLYAWIIISFIGIVSGNYFLNQERYFMIFIPAIMIILAYSITKIINKINSNKLFQKRVLYLIIIFIILINIKTIIYQEKENTMTKLPFITNENINSSCIIVSEESLMFNYFENFQSGSINYLINNMDLIHDSCIILFEEGYCNDRKSCEHIKEHFKTKKILEKEYFSWYSVN